MALSIKSRLPEWVQRVAQVKWRNNCSQSKIKFLSQERNAMQTLRVENMIL